MVADVNTTVQSGGVMAVSTIAMAVTDDPDGLAQSQKPLAAGALTLNGALISGGLYTGTGARRMVIVSDADDSGATFTITGTNRSGSPQSETLTGPNTATVTSVLDYLTVTAVSISAAAVGNITAGTSPKASGEWIQVNTMIQPISIAVLCQLVSGAANFTEERTYDDPNAALPGSIQPGSNSPPLAWPDPTIVARTATIEGIITEPVFAYRLTVNSGTGKVRMQGIQAGLSQ